jgi:S-adenosylmethionine synthetase
MARYVAKNVVAAGIADKCEVQLAYAIGVAQPVSVHVDTFKTEKIAYKKIIEIIREVFDMRPSAIIQKLDLLRPIYKPTAAYGHFGRSPEGIIWTKGEGFTWEKCDMADALRSAAGL